MSIADIISINNSKKKNDQIMKEDVVNALKQMAVFGPVVTLVDGHYVSFGSLLPSAELGALLAIYRREDKINWGICEEAGWTPEHFDKVIVG